jgi:hypothetical protein
MHWIPLLRHFGVLVLQRPVVASLKQAGLLPGGDDP